MTETAPSLAQIEIGEPVADTPLFRIVEAHLTGVGRPTVLKVTQEGVLDAAAAARCVARAAAGRHVRHANLVPLFAIEGVDDALAFVVERIDGQSLERRLRTTPWPAFDALARWTAQIARALDIVHARNLAHGAVRPATVLIERQSGTARLIDLASAAVDRESQGLEEATPTTDLADLATLFVALMRGSGEAPAAPPEPLARLVRDVGDPKRRPASGNGFAAAIEAALAATNSPARAAAVPPKPGHEPGGRGTKVYAAAGLAEAPAKFEPKPALGERPAARAPAAATTPERPRRKAVEPVIVPADADAAPAGAGRGRRRLAALAFLLTLLGLLLLVGAVALFGGSENGEETIEAGPPPVTETAAPAPAAAPPPPSLEAPEPAETAPVPATTAPPPPANVPEPPRTFADLDAWARTRPCTRIERVGGGLRGYTNDPNVATALRERAGGLANAGPVEVALVQDRPELCRLYDLLAAQTAVAPDAAFADLWPGGEAPVLQDGDPVIVSLGGLAPGSHVRVDYLMADGAVRRLWPTEGQSEVTGPDLLVGNPAGAQLFTVAPPFGREAIVAFASPEPLFPADGPDTVPADAYLAALKTALDGAPTPPSIATITLLTAPRPADG